MNSILRPYISEAWVSEKFAWTETTVEVNGKEVLALMLEGEFQRAGKPNKNKRVYEESLLYRETGRLQGIIKERNGILMGMDHPIPNPNDPPALQMQTIKRISLENSCALNTVLEMNQGIVYGKARVLTGDHGNGDKLAAMIRHKFRPAVSSRGLGGDPINRGDGFLYVPESYQMVTYDMVSDPSTHNAILEQAIQEEVWLIEQQNKYHRSLWDVMISFSKK